MKTVSNKNLKKLFEISSEPINVENEEITINNTIEELGKSKSGFFAFKSALHVFGGKEQEEVNKIMSKSPLCKKECYYFAEDLFGNLFCTNNSKFYLLDIESGAYEYISDSFDNWAKEILNDYNYLTGYSLADEWQKENRPLKTNERLIPKIFFILGGQYNIENLYPMDRNEALSLRFDMFKQLKDISDGDSIIIENK